jgi:hypothetical protein
MGRGDARFRRFFRILAFLLLTASLPAGIPYTAALDSASVTETNFSDIGMNGFPMGNGDLNAILWEQDGILSMRVAKVDLWDARIETSQDPPLLKMDIRAKKWSGGAGKVPSWSNHDYPQPRKESGWERAANGRSYRRKDGHRRSFC